MSGDPRRKAVLGVLSPLGNLEKAEWVEEGSGGQTLSSCGLATLRLPPGCCAEADRDKGWP